MQITETVPGMQPEETARNTLVGLCYITVVTVLLPVAARTYRPIRGC